mmetsp:Transcript_136182/g.339613  ORF Transcript_136182/g.339613 Transcript_136182/m.339613 type:complete len:212 (-) Transcript_136182:32-667(-)
MFSVFGRMTVLRRCNVRGPPRLNALFGLAMFSFSFCFCLSLSKVICAPKASPAPTRAEDPPEVSRSCGEGRSMPPAEANCATTFTRWSRSISRIARITFRSSSKLTLQVPSLSTCMTMRRISSLLVLKPRKLLIRQISSVGSRWSGEPATREKSSLSSWASASRKPRVNRKYSLSCSNSEKLMEPLPSESMAWRASMVTALVGAYPNLVIN